MKIEFASTFNYNQKPTFRSAYPIYHWHKSNGIYMPVFDVDTAKKYQKQILGILNLTKHLCGNFSKNFIVDIHDLISKYDKDFQETPCALSFYNNNAGEKYDWRGEICDIKPCTYLVTGSDALFLEKFYRRPIGHTKFDAKMYNNANDPNVKESMFAYYMNGRDFVNKKAQKFRNENHTEVHAIFKNGRPVKIGFYPIYGKNNPFVKMGYYDTNSEIVD